MFTGLIEYTGIVEYVEKRDAGAALTIRINRLSQATPGDSIAVNGACLTLTSVNRDLYSFNISPETILKANFLRMKQSDIVNIELPRRLSDRLHGHIVNGHIDCTALIVTIRASGSSYLFTFELSRETHYLVEKGFVAVDGISVTPYNVHDKLFSVAVIPYTYEHTNLSSGKTGKSVNIEFDIVAKYINSMLNKNKGNVITEEFLKRKGFA